MEPLLSIGMPRTESERQLRRLAGTEVPSFNAKLAAHNVEPLTTTAIDVLQVNVGKLCNQTCTHCHVDAGPDRTEVMTAEVADQVIALLEKHPSIGTLDITGGAPELNGNFRSLVERARALGRHVIDRCNLTVLLIQGQSDLVDFLAAHDVEVVASLPCFSAEATDAQRGEGVFDKSIRALQKLNAAGYGRDGVHKLHLVHNPVSASLPGSQCDLQTEYKRVLKERFDIDFDELFTITNIPISRYLDYLDDNDQLLDYMNLLVDSFNPTAASEVMCRSMISVSYNGRIYDCDFNQMLEMEVGFGAPQTLTELLRQDDLSRRILTDRHCYGCTAGAGSSCGGETV